jgi:hypothetical protein
MALVLIGIQFVISAAKKERIKITASVVDANPEVL